MSDEWRKEPPYVAIWRLVEHIIKNEERDYHECEDRLGPIRNRDHIFNSAHEVQSWLDVLQMTPWAQDMVDRDFQ